MYYIYILSIIAHSYLGESIYHLCFAMLVFSADSWDLASTACSAGLLPEHRVKGHHEARSRDLSVWWM